MPRNSKKVNKVKEIEMVEEKPMKKAKVSMNKKFLIIPALLIIAFLAFRFKGLLIAATVNGEPISRVAVVQELEKEGGKTVLGNFVTNALILQEAKKEKVTVSSTEIGTQISQIESNLKTSGQDLTSALAAQGMTRGDLENQVKLQILVQKMAGKNIEVSDAEAQDYFKKNQSTYPKGTKYDSVKTQIMSDLQQQKLNDAITTWISGLKTKAKINYWVSY